MNTTSRIKQSVTYLDISDDNDGQRLDNFLLSKLHKLPRSHLYRIIRTGQVRVNGGRCKISTRLNCGDKVRIPPLDLEIKESNVPSTHQLDFLQNTIFYEDEHLVAINKPSQFSVHSGSGIKMGIIEVLKHVPRFSSFFELGHRLDRETSGTLIFARSRKALTGLHELFRRERSGMSKTYHALCLGKLPQKVFDVNRPILRINKSQGAKCIVHADGQNARSTFLQEECFHESSLVKIRLHTGRTHQARVHAVSVKCPILGDSMYGDFAANRRFKHHGLDRLFLHASQLEFIHPITRKVINLHSPLPEDLQNVLTNLR